MRDALGSTHRSAAIAGLDLSMTPETGVALSGRTYGTETDYMV